jgi:hypothetical protein
MPNDREAPNPWLETIAAHPRAQLAVDRVRAVINGKIPDRVPFCDGLWSEFAERYRAERGLPPDASMSEHFDYDYPGPCVPMHGPWPGGAGPMGTDAEGYRLRRSEYGLVTREIVGTTAVPQNIDCRIKNKRDLDRFPFEDPRDPVRYAGIEKSLERICTRYCPVMKLGGPFSRSWMLRGISQFLLDLAADPLFAREMVDRMTDHMIAVGLAAIEHLDPPRILWHLADDFAATNGPLFSPKTYEDIFLPNLKKMVDALHAKGFKVSYESEGNVAPMLDLLDESGVDGLAHMEPRAGLFLHDLRERFGTRFFYMGNLCNALVLPSNDRRKIGEEVYRVLSAATDGYYMGLSAHSIAPDVTSDAYDYFWDLMNRYGRYPIDLDGLRVEIQET